MYYTINKMSRSGFKWTVNETLALQREFELLRWNVDQIATKHKRTPNAIMYKLDQEGFADYNVLYSNYHNLNSQIPVRRNPNEDNSVSEIDDEDDEYTQEDADADADADAYDDDDLEEDEDEDEDNNLANRVYGLEESIKEIKDAIQNMMNSFTYNNVFSKSSYY